MIIMLQHIYDYNRVEFLKYFKRVLLLNYDIQLVNNFSFDRSESYVGSRVPVIQGKIEYTDSIIKMIKTLPNSIQYLDHIISLERRIDYLKVDKRNEEMSDFMEYYE